MLRRGRVSETVEALRTASYPHPYPEGWYRLLLSKSLRRGAVRGIECLGRKFVVWREHNRDGVHVMDAFCPHLGTDLAFGRVREDCIECPFHAWRFNGEGRVRHIPYSDHLPDQVLNEPYPVQEVHGQIFIYFRNGCSQHAASDPPPYDVPRIPEMDDGRFVLRGHHNAGLIRAHIVEIAENAVDPAHFQTLHGRLHIPWTTIRVPGVRIRHQVEWTLDDECWWKMHFVDNAVLEAFGHRVDRAAARAQVSYIGPGSLLTFRFTIPGQGDIEMHKTLLPIGPFEQQVDFRWFADRKLPKLLVWYIIGNWASQLPMDVRIWERKVYKARPKLSRDDGPVFAMRRWYRQFLPETQDGA